MDSEVPRIGNCNAKPRKPTARKRGTRPVALRPPGQPSRYKPEFCEIARALASRGALDRDVAEFLGVTSQTIYNWRLAYPDFAEALTRGKDVANDIVEARMFDQAVGYDVEDEVVTVVPSGATIRNTIIRHVPPNAKVGMWFLQNRKPKDWAAAPRDARFSIDLGQALQGAEGLTKAMAAILDALGQGLISAGQAQDMARVVTAAGDSIERGALAANVEILKLEGPK
jgi:hypothetical protein